jgi:hypothetical protein
MKFFYLYFLPSNYDRLLLIQAALFSCKQESILGKNFTEGNGSFDGQMVRSSEVVAAMERGERKEERKKENSTKPSFTVSLIDALLW